VVRDDPDERYEPLPGLPQLPGYIWRRLSRPARLALGAAALGAVVLIVLLAPVIDRSKEEHARAEAERSARIQAQSLARTKREQRPRFGRGAPARQDLAARRELVASMTASIESDASRRAAAGEFNGPILRVECAGYPRSEGVPAPEQDPSRRVALYSCLAVTSDIPATSGNRPGVVGHPYRARLDFRNGRYAFCKVRGRPGELAIKAPSGVALSPVCGG